MKAFLTLVIAAVSGFLGLSVANLIFPSLLNARFPQVVVDQAIEATSIFGHYSWGLFIISGVVGASVFARLSNVFVGILTAPIAGILAGALSTAIYFYSTYGFSN